MVCSRPDGKYYHFSAIAFLLLSSQILTGCQLNPLHSASSKPLPAAGSSSFKPKIVAKQDNKTDITGAATVCERELVSLSSINPASYGEKREKFNALLRSATAYKDIRGGASPQMRESLDSFYKFKMLRLCSEIEMSLQQGLIGLGDKA